MKKVLAIIIELMIIMCIFVLSGCNLSPGPGKEASKSVSPVSPAGPKFSIGTQQVSGTVTNIGRPLFSFRSSSDPHARVFNGQVYIYCSQDMYGNSGGGIYPMNTTYCYSSADLVNWKDNGAVMTENQLPWAAHGSNELWAPCCVQNPNNGQYYLYEPDEPNNGANSYDKRIGVSVASSPTGPFTPLQNYISIPRVANAPQGDFNCDPFVFIDTANGNTPYLLYCDGNNPNGRDCIVQMNSDFETVSKQPVTVDSLMANGVPANQFEEGPRLFYINSKYYLIMPVSYGGSEYLAYAISTQGPMGPYTFKGNFMSQNQAEWTIQGDIVQFDNKNVLFYHDVQQPQIKGFYRQVCGEYFYFNSDGLLPQISRTQQGLTIDTTNIVQAASYFTASSGVQTESTGDPGSGLDVGWIQNGSWIEYSGMNFANLNITGFTISVASATSGGNIYIMAPSTGGLGWVEIGQVSVPSTGGWQNWTTVTCPINYNSLPGPQTIELQFSGGSGYLLNIDQFQFSGNGGIAPGTYKIINRNSGTAMDMTGFSTSAGTQAQIWAYGGGANQKWTLQPSGP